VLESNGTKANKIQMYNWGWIENPAPLLKRKVNAAFLAGYS
jgi:hypothetical protein